MDNLELFKAMADLTRLRILRILKIRPLCVCEVMHVLKMAQSTISRHLQILSRAGLIEALPGGTWTVYRIVTRPRDPVITELLNLIDRFKKTNEMKDDAMAARKVDRYKVCLR